MVINHLQYDRLLSGSELHMWNVTCQIDHGDIPAWSLPYHHNPRKLSIHRCINIMRMTVFHFSSWWCGGHPLESSLPWKVPLEFQLLVRLTYRTIAWYLIFDCSLGCLPLFLGTRTPEHILDIWAKKYGPIYSFWLGNQRFVILSDPSVVKDLLVSQGAIFSSRKDFHIKSHIILAGRGITATPYNAKWQVLFLRNFPTSWWPKYSGEHIGPLQGSGLTRALWSTETKS